MPPVFYFGVVRYRPHLRDGSQVVTRIMRGGALVLPPGLRTRSVYLLVDHAAPPTAFVPPPAAKAVFENHRVSIYRYRLSGT